MAERSDDANTLWIARTDRQGGAGAGDSAPLGEAELYRRTIARLPVATAVLDRAGIVALANRAFCELLQLEEGALRGEPLMQWMPRLHDREGFGRAFLQLREREAGRGFILDVELRGRLGPPVRCTVRTVRLSDGHVTLTAEPDLAAESSAEAGMGRAIMRSLDALDHGVLLVDVEARIVHANPAAGLALGGALVGHSAFDIVDPAAVFALTRALSAARAGSWQGELELRRLDGEPLPAEVTIAAGAGDGAPAVVFVRDLRERRRREFEDRLVAQVDRQLVSSTDPRDAVMAACGAVAAALGVRETILVVKVRGAWERWALRGDRPTPIRPVPADCAPPPAWSELRGVEWVALADPAVQACFAPELPHEPTRAREPDAASAAEGSAAGQAALLALRAPSGVVGSMLLVADSDAAWDGRDVALLGLLSSQIALGLANGLLTIEARALAEYQARVLDQTSVMINSIDGDGRVLTWNRASEAALGIPAAAALGRRFGVEVACAADPQHWEELWDELQQRGEVASQLSVRAADGREVPMHVEARALADSGPPGHRGAVIVGLDMGERRELERQVLRSQKLAAVGLLAAGIAHEINNPLSGVVGYAKLLLERELPPDIRVKVERIAHSGERCRKIVEGVLLFSRRQEGGERRRVQVADLVERVVAIGEYQWRMHNIRIVRELHDPGAIVADADQIEQVLLNLLSNAVDAMPRGGTITIGLRRTGEGRAIELAIADQGVGIPEEIQARIFDPFFSTKEIGKGTGLGLAISYGIVGDHGGTIRLVSAPGQGATFTVVLPAAEAGGGAGDPLLPAEAGGAGVSPP